MRTKAVPLLWLAVASCRADLALPEGTRIACENNQHCPAGLVCDAALGRCVERSGNQPPTLAIGTIARSVSSVSIPLTIFDEEQDEVTLSAVLESGGIAEPITVSPGVVAAKRDGQELTVTWDAVAFFGSSAFVDDLVLRITPRDADGAGASLRSQPFAFGNDAPEITTIVIDASTAATGEIVVHLAVTDSSADLVSLDVEAFVDSATTARALPSTTFAAGSLDGLAGDGAPLRLSWRPHAVVPESRPVRLRFVATDQLGATSAAVDSDTFTLDNSPRLSVEPPSPGATKELEIAYGVTDPNRADGDRAEVSFAVVVDGGAPVDISTVTDVTTDGARHVLVWDLLADGAVLGTRTVATAFDGGSSEVVVRHHPSVVVHARASDQGGNSGSSVVIGPFRIGNDPPTSTLRAPTGLSRGEVTLDFTLSDSGGDPAAIVLEFLASCGECGSHWRRAAIGRGATSDLATSPDGRQHLVTWDSAAPLLPDAADAATPQGIGERTLTGTRMRLRAYDLAADGTPHFEDAASEVTLGEVSNQSPPRAQQISATQLLGRAGSGPVSLSYQLVDAESDPVDLRIEFSNDNGVTWQPCEEHPIAASEGRHGLATAPLDGNGQGGVFHTFVWDPTASAWSGDLATRLRFTASDAFGSLTTDTYLPARVGPPRAATNPSPFVSLGVTASTYGSPATPLAVHLDEDGVVDLAVLSAANDSLHVLLNDGAGALTETASYATGDEPVALAAADLDGDGDQDLVVSARAQGRVDVFVNDGSGALTGPSSVTVAAEVGSLALADFDGDADPDVAVLALTSAATPELHVLRGAGGAALSPWQVHALAEAASDIVAGNFDGTGRPDVAVATPAGVTVRAAGVDGQLGVTVVYATSIAPTDLAVAEINRDGIDDLIILCDWICERAATLVSTGAGYVEGAPTAVGDPAVDVSGADVNGDGLTDAIVTYEFLASVAVLLSHSDGGIGTGGFAAPLRLSLANSRSSSVAVADLDADGLSDLAVTTGAGTDPVEVLRGRPASTGSTSFAGPMASGSADHQAEIAAADLDADGITDVATCAGFEVVVHAGAGTSGVGDGFFAAPVQLGGGDDVTVADFDGNGMLDVVSVGFSLERWLGDPETGELSNSYLGSGGDLVEVGDFDGDGDLDLVIVGSFGDLAVWLGGGDGSFAPPVVSAASGFVQDIAVADLNADGRSDVALLVSGAQDVAVRLASAAGDGTLGGPATFSSGLFPATRMAAADFNADGIVDLAVAGRNDIGVLVGRGSNGRGDGTFAAAEPYGGVADAAALEVLDVNRDGILDLVAVNAAPRDVLVLAGDGAGGVGDASFTSLLSMSVPGDAVAAAVADLSEDGLPDLVVAGNESDDIVVVLAQLEHFREPWRRPVTAWPLTGAVAAFGEDVLPSGTDRLGQSIRAHVSQHRLHGSIDGAPSFAMALQRSALLLPAGMLPLSHPWSFAGDVRLARVAGPTGLAEETGDRLRVERRFGPRTASSSTSDFDRRGLSLMPQGAEPQRGLVIELPILDARSDASIASAISIRVFRRTHDWLRASAVASDPLSGHPDASRYLPRVPAGAGYRDLIAELPSYDEIPRDVDGDLGTGQGRRFIVDTTPGHRRVRVLTDQLGVYQAFVVP